MLDRTVSPHPTIAYKPVIPYDKRVGVTGKYVPAHNYVERAKRTLDPRSRTILSIPSLTFMSFCGFGVVSPDPHSGTR